MNLQQANHYLKTQVQTASKEQLLLMLFDGAIRFSEQAKARIEARDFEMSYLLLVKSQRIVMELITALDAKRIEAELFQNLMSLYNFIYQKLVEANMRRRTESIDQAVGILRHLRDTWAEAIRRMEPEARAELVANTTHPHSAGLLVEG